MTESVHTAVCRVLPEGTFEPVDVAVHESVLGA
jgi:hypothetical protein